MKKLSILTLLLLILSNCSSSKINDEMILEFISISPISVTNTKGTLTIYGHDKLLADVSATPIIKKEVAFAETPFRVALNIPKTPEALITPSITSKKNAKYYVSFYSDVNKNGKDDEGDIKIDFNQGFPNVDIESKDIQQFYLKVR